MSDRLIRIEDKTGVWHWFYLERVRSVREEKPAKESILLKITTTEQLITALVSPATRDWLLSVWTNWTDVLSPPT